jgi:hypothetical protein
MGPDRTPRVVLATDGFRRLWAHALISLLACLVSVVVVVLVADERSPSRRAARTRRRT